MKIFGADIKHVGMWSIVLYEDVLDPASLQPWQAVVNQ